MICTLLDKNSVLSSQWSLSAFDPCPAHSTRSLETYLQPQSNTPKRFRQIYLHFMDRLGSQDISKIIYVRCFCDLLISHF